ncbi:MBL fold metallo-hydrolase [Cellvibrio japonicus]|uniref:Metallo-beta-lactamase superfamily domain protein n=1 Tax=Cellvibrio japonicus (strain Ueda107) TaxID=498211 RepID=B3PC17_CELJU|nr:MBL fold metallo-hydrolase [Cellvibrio japonicus]ACE85311.1 metallo-beta-lactamase superfamily domain protein [Cellvibrio japonicus Ueda107]QEI13170.1 MBL fold metallo-hydrolase [Cellvibrio japonicus]QEI16744.1 MBL fold metallo-hydrolase [Cellvibrio japonicus]QEI20322.1 MBL fold metallo-hydrolase [Cellvibrio japonicus]
MDGPFRFASLGSGSRGNATLVNWGQGHVLIDCGFSVREAEQRLARFELSPGNLDAILVTHEHADHIKGVAALARRYQLPVYMTPGTYHSRSLGELPDLRLIESYTPFNIGNLWVQPVAVPHDAREPTQFVFEYAGRRLGILTDLGSITPHVEACYQDLDAMVLEANHDPVMLAYGPYPHSLKQRVGGHWGHLSNQQAAGFLQRLNCARLQHLVVAHISQQNNSLAVAQAALAPVTAAVKQVTYACQNQGFDWLSVV